MHADEQHDQRVDKRRRFKSRNRERAKRNEPIKIKADTHPKVAAAIENAQVNHNEPTAKDEQLDVIAEEGTNELLRTEGAAAPENAYRGEYAEGERHNSIPTPKGSPSVTLQESPEEIEEDDAASGFPFEEVEDGTEIDVEYEGEKRRRKKQTGDYAGWIGSKRGERIQREIYM